jgi:rhamnulose-1-phosphate aldolase
MAESRMPALDALLAELGDAGRRLREIDACEGAAGNISVCLRQPPEPSDRFSAQEVIELPQAVSKLAGAAFLVSGSGCRLRDIIRDPCANLGWLVVGPEGRTARLYTSPNREFARLTTEFNSHLAVHEDQMAASGTDLHAVIHAQPPFLTYLSHIPAYQDEAYLNGQLLRWQPETILQFPEGLSCIPFHTPGSPELMAKTVVELRQHRLVVWAKHGVMARSALSVSHAADLIEYAEAAARYEYLDLAAGREGAGLSPEELRTICSDFDIRSDLV